MMADRSPPSRVWYIPVVLLVLLAGVSAAVATYISITAVKLTQVELPGSVDFSVDEPGKWIVCGESVGSPSLEIEFTTAGMVPLPMVIDSMVLTYTIGSRQGRGIGHVVIPAVGTWTMTATLPEGEVDDGTRWAYAYGPDPIQAVFLPILIGGGLAVVLVTLGLSGWGLVFWLRLKALKAAGTGVA